MKDKKEILMSYIKANVVPILVKAPSGKDIIDAIVIPANIDVKELNGHYEGLEYMPPKWYTKLVNNKKTKLLVIDSIDTIDKEEQLKFVELLEYRKISTFDLPKDCVVIVTAKEIDKDKINEEIYSLVAQM